MQVEASSATQNRLSPEDTGEAPEGFSAVTCLPEGALRVQREAWTHGWEAAAEMWAGDGEGLDQRTGDGSGVL